MVRISKVSYSHILVTRLDVVNSVYIHYDYTGRHNQHVVVALNADKEERVDDRAFMGAANIMMLLEPLFNETRTMFLPFRSYNIAKNGDNGALSPEHLLYHFMLEKFSSSPELEVKMLPLKGYISILHFIPWASKYDIDFSEKLATSLNTTVKKRECSDISNVGARETCFASLKMKKIKKGQKRKQANTKKKSPR